LFAAFELANVSHRTPCPTPAFLHGIPRWSLDAIMMWWPEFQLNGYARIGVFAKPRRLIKIKQMF